jgi:anti-sigma regulatory factor (Ser/Thr protein kinase)
MSAPQTPLARCAGSRAIPLEIRAEPLEIRRASTWLRTSGTLLGVPEPQLDRLELCLNEVLANLLEHGGAAVAAAPIRLLFELGPETPATARLVVMDAGMPFDPLQRPDKPLANSLQEASPGGVGLRMVRAYCDRLKYQALAGHNELSVEINL